MNRSQMSRGSTPMNRSGRINPRSKKRAKFMREVYVPMVVEAVGGGRRPCPVRSAVCTRHVEGLHEVVTRGRAGGLVAAIRLGEIVPCCHPCNGWISENSLEAGKLKLIKHIWEAR